MFERVVHCCRCYSVLKQSICFLLLPFFLVSAVWLKFSLSCDVVLFCLNNNIMHTSSVCPSRFAYRYNYRKVKTPAKATLFAESAPFCITGLQGFIICLSVLKNDFVVKTSLYSTAYIDSSLTEHILLNCQVSANT